MIEELGGELGAVGIRGRLRRRILDEFRDHLACDAEAELGDPRLLARQFADELGTARSRRAAFAAFGALAVAGLAYTAAFVAAAYANLTPPDLHARTPLLGDLVGATIVLAPQLAFVAGSLTLLRAFRRRRERALPAAEVHVLLRRTAVALTGGLAAMGAIALYAYEYSATLPDWLGTLAYAAAAVGGAALVLAAPPVFAAVRVRGAAPGDGGDVFDDLGPLVPARLRGNPWRFARAVALVVGLAVWGAGIAQGDPLDGLLRGLFDAAACFAGFAVLGRFLGLRR